MWYLDGTSERFKWGVYKGKAKNIIQLQNSSNIQLGNLRYGGKIDSPNMYIYITVHCHGLVKMNDHVSLPKVT